MLFRWYVVKKLNIIKIILVFSILISSGCGTYSYQRAIYDNQAENVGLEVGQYSNGTAKIYITKTSNNRYNYSTENREENIIAKRLSSNYYLIQCNSSPFEYYVISVVGKRQFNVFLIKDEELKAFATANGLQYNEAKGYFRASSGTALFNFFQKVVIEKPSILGDQATYKK